MLLARQHEFGRGERIGKLPRLFGDLPRIDTDESDREQNAQPDAHHVNRRQLQRVFAVPRQWIVHEYEHRRAGDREAAEHQREARRQRGGRQQHRPEEQERERVLQPAGEKQQYCKFGDVERQKPGRAIGREPLRHVEAQPQCHIEPGRKDDRGEAGIDRQLEIEPVVNHDHRGRLTDDGEPAQPDQRVEAHVPQRVLLGKDGRHGRSLAWTHCLRIVGLAIPAAGRHTFGLMDAQNASAIAVDQLVKRYKGVAAVDGITFSLAPGSVTGLLGGNGAGKTTTIAMIMGLVTPTSGSVIVLGAEMPRQRYRVLHRMNFESPYVDVPMRLTVRQNLSVFAQLYAVSDIDERIDRLAADLDLTDFLDRPTGKLSAGQKTRVSLAKALLNKPEVLLLDEPTASLDPDTADWVRSRLERYRAEEKATILLASHNMAEVERLCERVIIMHRGRIEDDDKPDRLLSRYGRETLEDVFLDVARGRGEAAREAAQ